MITQEELKNNLCYCPFSGEFKWNIEKQGVYIGKIAGHERKCNDISYIMINVNDKTYLAHRLAFLYMKGYLPKEIDHIDGDGTNNKWNNLRDVPHSINMKNQKRSKNNKSGITGVSWHKKSSKWISKIVVDGEYKYLGTFSNIEDAIKARKEAEIKYKFHKNHDRVA